MSSCHDVPVVQLHTGDLLHSLQPSVMYNCTQWQAMYSIGQLTFVYHKQHNGYAFSMKYGLVILPQNLHNTITNPLLYCRVSPTLQ